MKKTALIVSILLVFLPVFAASVYGDEVEDGLPDAASEKVKERTREMIRSGIPSLEAVGMTGAMVRNRFREEHVIRAQDIVMDARNKGIPAAAIIGKVFEGVAKKAPDDAVVRAMEATASRYGLAYDHARAVARDRSRVDGIASAIADSLAAGMNPGDIGRIMASVRERSQTMNRNQVEELALETFQVTRTMARLGVRSNSAADVVCQAHQQRFSLSEMKQVHQSFRENATRTSSGRVAEQFSREIGRGEKAPGSGSGSGGRGRGAGGEGTGAGGESGGGAGSGSGGAGGGGSGPGGGSDSGGAGSGSGSGEGSGAGGGGGSGPGGSGSDSGGGPSGGGGGGSGSGGSGSDGSGSGSGGSGGSGSGGEGRR